MERAQGTSAAISPRGSPRLASLVAPDVKWQPASPRLCRQKPAPPSPVTVAPQPIPADTEVPPRILARSALHTAGPPHAPGPTSPHAAVAPTVEANFSPRMLGRKSPGIPPPMEQEFRGSDSGEHGAPGATPDSQHGSTFSDFDPPAAMERRGTVASVSGAPPNLEEILGTPVPEDPETYTEATRKRTHVFKVFLRQFYRDLFQYRSHRALRKADLEMEIESLHMRSEQAAAVRTEAQLKETQYLRLKRTKTRINDFVILAMLGKGGYGEVFLAREKGTGRVVALKRMTKNSARMKNQVDEVQRERNVLCTSQSPWIIRLIISFQDTLYLYMGMEYAPGGDLRWLFNSLGRLEDAMASIYMAEMVLCTKYLHSLGYIHRDLKPSNFVIDSVGHLKLIDFGLSREGYEERWRGSVALRRSLSSDKLAALKTAPAPRAARFSYSIVGSPDYMCPEMLQGTGYDQRADWWAIGAIFFEMVCGYGAFEARSAEEAFENVLNFERVTAQKPVMPASELPVPSDAWDLICHFITSEDKRFGRHGAGEIMAHPYFIRRGLQGPQDWDGLRDRPGPFVPQLQSESDTSYFGEDDEKMTREELRRSVESAELPSNYFSRIHDESYFAGFTYKAFPSKTQ